MSREDARTDPGGGGSLEDLLAALSLTPRAEAGGLEKGDKSQAKGRCRQEVEVTREKGKCQGPAGLRQLQRPWVGSFEGGGKERQLWRRGILEVSGSQ